MGEETRQCPLCEATIPDGQKKCLFCGSLLIEEEEETKPAAKELAGPSEGLIIAAYAMVALSTVALWFGVWRLSPLAPRMLYFLALVGLTCVVTAILVAVDAKRVDVASHAYSTPAKWFWGTLFLLPLALCVYAAVRARCGARDSTRPALILASVWTLSAGIVWHAAQQEPELPPQVKRQYEEQLQRTLEVSDRNHFDPNATVSPSP